MRYLRTTNDKIEFLVDGIHDIRDTDIPILENDFETFFKSQESGKQFRLKPITSLMENNNGLFDMVEEYTPEPVKMDKTETEILIERILSENETLKNENDSLKADIQKIKDTLGI